MTTTLSDTLFSLPVRRLRGDWLMDGYIADDNDETFRVVVLDGVAYSMDMLEHGLAAEDCALDIDADGTLGVPGSRSRFSAVESEFRRIGLSV